MNAADRRRRATLAWTWACLGGFAALTAIAAIAPRSLTALDDALGAFPRELTAAHPALRAAAEVVETATQPDVLVFAALATGACLFAMRRQRAAEFAVLNPVLARYGYPVVKNTLERPRPTWEGHVEPIAGWSFPSGHTTVAAAAAGTAIALLVMFTEPGRARGWGTRAAVAFALLVGLDRLALGAHYPSDVLGGLLLGAGITLAGWLLIDPRLDREAVPAATGSEAARQL